MDGGMDGAESRNLNTFSRDVSSSKGGSLAFMSSSLILRSFNTTASRERSF